MPVITTSSSVSFLKIIKTISPGLKSILQQYGVTDCATFQLHVNDINHHVNDLVNNADPADNNNTTTKTTVARMAADLVYLHNMIGLYTLLANHTLTQPYIQQHGDEALQMVTANFNGVVHFTNQPPPVVKVRVKQLPPDLINIILLIHKEQQSGKAQQEEEARIAAEHAKNLDDCQKQLDEIEHQVMHFQELMVTGQKEYFKILVQWYQPLLTGYQLTYQHEHFTPAHRVNSPTTTAPNQQQQSTSDPLFPLPIPPQDGVNQLSARITSALTKYPTREQFGDEQQYNHALAQMRTAYPTLSLQQHLPSDAVHLDYTTLIRIHGHADKIVRQQFLLGEQILQCLLKLDGVRVVEEARARRKALSSHIDMLSAMMDTVKATYQRYQSILTILYQFACFLRAMHG